MILEKNWRCLILVRKENLFFLVLFIVAIGLVYAAINQAYSTGEAISSKSNCFDSDKGKSYYTSGYVRYSTKQGFRSHLITKKDFCINNFSFESYCDSRGLGVSERFLCHSGCKDGACIIQCNPNQVVGDVDNDGKITVDDVDLVSKIDAGIIQPPSNICCADIDESGKVDIFDSLFIEEVIEGKRAKVKRVCPQPQLTSDLQCTDSDGGKDYYTRGNGTGLYSSDKEKGWVWGKDSSKASKSYEPSINYTVFYDHCLDSDASDQINEAYCGDEGILYSISYSCPNGCASGKCLTSPPKRVLEPKGDIKVLVFEVKPYDYYDKEERECYFEPKGWDAVGTGFYDPSILCRNGTTISFFNREKGIDTNPSIYFIKGWYESQARSYGIKNFSISLDIVGPYVTDKRFEYGFKNDPEIPSFFRNLSEQKGYKKKDYDVINYVYFDDSSKGGFRSFANMYEGETFNSIGRNGIDSVQGILHEMGHTFGGDDLYAPRGWGCEIPDGIPEPKKKPLFPQTQACLMCNHIMLNENSSIELDYLSKQLILCDYTAKQFRWKA